MRDQVDPPETKDYYDEQYDAYTGEDAGRDNVDALMDIFNAPGSMEENIKKAGAFIEQTRRDYADKWRGENPGE